MGRAGRPTVAIELADEERETLLRWSRRHSSSQALALRPRILPRSVDYESVTYRVSSNFASPAVLIVSVSMTRSLAETAADRAAKSMWFLARKAGSRDNASRLMPRVGSVSTRWSACLTDTHSVTMCGVIGVVSFREQLLANNPRLAVGLYELPNVQSMF